ncbi:hypothetical protein MKEN_00707500 [Mycena kentingensis (nom. inval.)]|nr:hypothetical protein MKEN_00707500 [Mycena kentingensis (nom. inval.)]
MPTPMPYSQPAGPHAAAVNTTLDMSRSILATLVGVTNFTPVPFLQEAVACALAIVATVQSARDNKEGFRMLANDACDLVSVVCTACNDIEGRGMTISETMKRNIRELNDLLQKVSDFSVRNASKSFGARILRLNTQQQKIQFYRGALRQALDKFGLQTSISIHENLMQLRKDIDEEKQKREEAEAEREREREKFNDSPPPPPSPGSSSSGSDTYNRGSGAPGNTYSNIFGNMPPGSNITIKTLNGDQNTTSYSRQTRIENSFNGWNGC